MEEIIVQKENHLQVTDKPYSYKVVYTKTILRMQIGYVIDNNYYNSCYDCLHDKNLMHKNIFTFYCQKIGNYMYQVYTKLMNALHFIFKYIFSFHSEI